jgi:hypothetical protein
MVLFVATFALAFGVVASLKEKTLAADAIIRIFGCSLMFFH